MRILDGLKILGIPVNSCFHLVSDYQRVQWKQLTVSMAYTGRFDDSRREQSPFILVVSATAHTPRYLFYKSTFFSSTFPTDSFFSKARL